MSQLSSLTESRKAKGAGALEDISTANSVIIGDILAEFREMKMLSGLSESRRKTERSSSNTGSPAGPQSGGIQGAAGSVPPPPTTARPSTDMSQASSRRSVYPAALTTQAPLLSRSSFTALDTDQTSSSGLISKRNTELPASSAAANAGSSPQSPLRTRSSNFPASDSLAASILQQARSAFADANPRAQEYALSTRWNPASPYRAHVQAVSPVLSQTPGSLSAPASSHDYYLAPSTQIVIAKPRSSAADILAEHGRMGMLISQARKLLNTELETHSQQVFTGQTGPADLQAAEEPLAVAPSSAAQDDTAALATIMANLDQRAVRLQAALPRASMSESLAAPPATATNKNTAPRDSSASFSQSTTGSAALQGPAEAKDAARARSPMRRLTDFVRKSFSFRAGSPNSRQAFLDAAEADAADSSTSHQDDDNDDFIVQETVVGTNLDDDAAQSAFAGAGKGRTSNNEIASYVGPKASLKSALVPDVATAEGRPKPRKTLSFNIGSLFGSGEASAPKQIAPPGPEFELGDANDPHGTVIKGVLSKCGSRNAFWHWRYCVLTQTQLRYYVTKADADRELESGGAIITRKGAVELMSVVLLVGSGKVRKTPTPYLFRLNTGRRTFVFAAKSEDSLLNWLGSLAAVTHSDLNQLLGGQTDYVDGSYAADEDYFDPDDMDANDADFMEGDAGSRVSGRSPPKTTSRSGHSDEEEQHVYTVRDPDDIDLSTRVPPPPPPPPRRRVAPPTPKH